MIVKYLSYNLLTVSREISIFFIFAIFFTKINYAFSKNGLPRLLTKSRSQRDAFSDDGNKISHYEDEVRDKVGAKAGSCLNERGTFMNSNLIEKSNRAGFRLRKYLLNKYANIKIETVLQKEISTLLKALNDNDYNLFMQTIIPIYSKYELDIPSVFYEMLKDDEHFIKILSAFIFGLKGAYREKKGHELEIDGEHCYDIKTVCQLLNVSDMTVYRWLKQGKIKRANSTETKHIYITKDDIDKLMSAR